MISLVAGKGVEKSSFDFFCLLFFLHAAVIIVVVVVVVETDNQSCRGSAQGAWAFNDNSESHHITATKPTAASYAPEEVLVKFRTRLT